MGVGKLILTVFSHTVCSPPPFLSLSWKFHLAFLIKVDPFPPHPPNSFPSVKQNKKKQQFRTVFLILFSFCSFCSWFSWCGGFGHRRANFVVFVLHLTLKLR